MSYREFTRAELVDHYEHELEALRAEHRREVAAWKQVAEAKRDPVWPYEIATLWAFVGAAAAGSTPWRALSVAVMAVGARLAAAGVLALVRGWR